MRALPPHIAAVQQEMTAFSSRPFPESCDGLTVDGVLLEGLDSNFIGCISTWVRNRGELDGARHQVLRECLQDMESVRGKLPEDAADYFAALERLGRQVIEALGG